jgi:hypothetical protein
MRVYLGFAIILISLVPVIAGAAPDGPPDAQSAAQRAISLIQKAASGYVKQRGCFACHHQAMAVIALTLAKDRGLDIDEAVLQEQVRFTENSLRGGKDGYRQGKGQGGGVETAGYALVTLEVGGWKADETTAAVTEYLLQRDTDREFWRTTANRPPSEATSFTATAVALRSLAAYGTPEQKDRIAARLARVKEWLLKTEAKDTEERVSRLWSLKYAGAVPAAIHDAARALLAAQRPDGGWAQVEGMESDAYATGSALVVLGQVGGLAATDPAFERGITFLVKAQRPDGSWYVKSRSKPFQPYFESGFPHGADQWISMAATCWATAALCLSLPAR